MNKKIIPYLTAYVVILLASCALLLMYPKTELHLMLNSWHTRVGDIFFKYYTQLAEWPLYVIALIPFFFHRWRWTVFYAISEGIAALIIFVVKQIVQEPRPVTYFEEIHNNALPLVQGVTMHHSNSFPSGHASTFFLFFTFVALLLCQSKTRKTVLLSTVMLFLAVLGCYSRVYLSQHFLSDVAAGSLIGILVPCLMFFFFGKKIKL